MHFTPTQSRMAQLLSDGLPHSKLELWQCLSDDLAPITAIRWQISQMRKVLRPKGEDVVCVVVNRRNFYQHVRLLASAVDGKR